MHFRLVMLDTIDHLPPGSIVPAKTDSKHLIPFFSSMVQGGFPSPADYVEYDRDIEGSNRADYLADNEVVL